MLKEFFNKLANPYEVKFHESQLYDDEQTSQPYDRPHAMGFVVGTLNSGGRIKMVLYAGKPISQQQFGDFIVDACVLNALRECADAQNQPYETFFLRTAPDDPSLMAYMEIAQQAVASVLNIPEDDAGMKIMGRLKRGLPRIADQRTP
jgi:hypothetical protein